MLNLVWGLEKFSLIVLKTVRKVLGLARGTKHSKAQGGHCLLYVFPRKIEYYHSRAELQKAL